MHIIFTKLILIMLTFNMILLMKNIKISDKALTNKGFEIASDPEYDGYQRGSASMVLKFFDKKLKGSGINSVSNRLQLANELHKPNIRKC